MTAFAAVLCFQLATLSVESLGSAADVASVKRIILWGLLVLVPALMAVNGSGFALAGGRRGGLLTVKRKRAVATAANGLVVLVPCAVVLDAWAAAGRLDAVFYAVQGLEITAGLANLALIGLNIRDGLRLTRARRPATAEA